jgi:hypothetical protein
MWPTHYIPKMDRVEGIPPPRLTLTTPPYPIEVIEEFKSHANVDAIAFGIGAEEEIKSGGALISGGLYERLVGIDGFLDEIESSGALISGVLVTRLKTYDNGRDEIESAGALISGQLRDPLVVYDNWPLIPDEMKSGGAVIGGTLT